MIPPTSIQDLEGIFLWMDGFDIVSASGVEKDALAPM
jgi:hypothetical protein